MNLIFLLLILLAQKDDFCSCIPLGPIDDKQYNEYNIIVKGKVVNVSESQFERTIYLKVDTYFKGKQKDSIVIIKSPSQSGECGIFPKVGEIWLMYAYASEKIYRTNLCTRTKNMNPKAWDYRKDELKQDLDFLEAKREE
jgi:hypothetical protein